MVAVIALFCALLRLQFNMTGVGRTYGKLDSSSNATTNSTSPRRALLSASLPLVDTGSPGAAAAWATLELQPLAHARATHWHPVQPGQEAVAATRRRLAATGGDDAAPAVGPARMVAWRRRLQAGNYIDATFTAWDQDIVTGNQATSLLTNGQKTNGKGGRGVFEGRGLQHCKPCAASLPRCVWPSISTRAM